VYCFEVIVLDLNIILIKKKESWIPMLSSQYVIVITLRVHCQGNLKVSHLKVKVILKSRSSEVLGQRNYVCSLRCICYH